MLFSLLTFCLIGGSLGQFGLIPENFVPLGVNTDGQFHKPAFCHNQECPKYTVIEANDKFEVRKYEPSVWVATELTTMIYTETDSSGMFWKLFHYIAGNNSAHMKIDMTTPVVTEVLHGPGPDCESNFTMHFMVPFHLQANPPQPTEHGVFIRHVPQVTVYVRSYGGYSTDVTKRTNIEQLVTDLNAANRQYMDATFYTAGYDGPYAINRHNEIWVASQ